MASAISRRPATQRIYQNLKDWALTSASGERLGCEAEILARLAASRPTFRQAASLLESEQLLEIRRGNGGGYYASRPTAATATRVTANYCRSLALSREEIVGAWTPIRVETVRQAARTRGTRAPQELAKFIAELRRGSDRHFADTVRRFNALLALLAGNRLLSLFFEILHESGNRIDHQDYYRQHPTRIAAYREQMVALAEAIAAGEEERADEASRRCVQLNLDWLAEDQPGGSVIRP